MKRILCHEFYKFFHSLTFKILLVCMAFFALMYLGMISLMLDSVQDMPEMAILGISTKGMGAALQSFSNYTDLGLFVGAVVVLVVVYDFTSQTIKNTAISDIPRGNIYIAKFIVEMTAIAILFLLNLVIQAGGITIFFGWGEGMTFKSLWDNLISITLLGLLVYISIAAFVNFFAYVTKNTVIVLVIVFVLMFILLIISMLSATIDNGFLDFINKFSITSVLSNYANNKTSENLIYLLVSSLLLLIPFFIWGYFIFQKQEIK